MLNVKGKRSGERQGLAARFATSQGVREELQRFRPWDGRTGYEARGCIQDKVIHKGEARSRDRRTMTDDGRELHVREPVVVDRQAGTIKPKHETEHAYARRTAKDAKIKLAGDRAIRAWRSF
jgi:hypothetical protein